MAKLIFRDLFKIWMFTSFNGAKEYNTTEVCLVKKEKRQIETKAINTRSTIRLRRIFQRRDK